MRLLIVLLALLLPATTLARPSLRLIQENAERYEEEQAANRHHQTYSNPDWGVSVKYPKTWLAPSVSNQVNKDGTKYTQVLFIPHDRDLEVNYKRDNYILELMVLAWEGDPESLDQFARQQAADRYREFWVLGARELRVAGQDAWSYEVMSMTGDRQEVWLKHGGRVFTLGFRSLNKYFDNDVFFFDDLLTSLTLSEPAQPSVTSSPAASSNLIFTDVADSHPYFSAIEWGKNLSILQGYADGSFGPDLIVNRAELLKIIFAARPDITVENFATPTGFSDVDENTWYGPYLRAAKALGIIQGYSNNTFKPGQAVNAAEALKMIYEGLGIQTQEAAGAWYQRYLSHALNSNSLYSALPLENGMKRKDIIWLVWRLSTQN